jgi:hypothetical protein
MTTGSSTAAAVKPLVFENDEGWTIPSEEDIQKFSTQKCGQMADELLAGGLIESAIGNFSKMSLVDKREALIGVVKMLTSAEPDVSENATTTPAEPVVPTQVELPGTAPATEGTSDTSAAVEPVDTKKNTKKAADAKKLGKTAGLGKGVVSDDDPINKYAYRIENLKSRGEVEEVIRDLMDDEGANVFKIGGALAKIQANESWWKESGYDTFKQYIETVCGISYRKGMYNIELYKRTLELKVSWSDFGGIGWTKVMAVLPVVTAENIGEWVEKAGAMNVLSLREYVKKVLEVPHEPGAPVAQSNVKAVTFKLHEDQKEIVDAAISKAKTEGNTEVASVALELIAQSYMGGSVAYTSIDAAMTAERKKSGSSDDFIAKIVGIMESLCPDRVIEVEVSEAAS